MTPDLVDQPCLRLAVFGWVQDGMGSVASAHYQLCQALLEAGHELDFFADPSFVPHPGFDQASFAYWPVPVRLSRELLPGHFPSSTRVVVERLNGMRRTRSFRESGVVVARTLHARRPYDAMLFLGTPPGSTIHGIPTVVWPQSCPQNELRAVRGLASAVTRVSGPGAYLKLRLYYEIKDRLVWRWTTRHFVIVCSQAARDATIEFGVPADRVCVAPYPIDLTRFQPSAPPTASQRKILCIGRLDPRKRIDLLVDAVALLARRRNDFVVDVIGRDGYLPGWAELVEVAGRTLPIRYTSAIAQSEVIRRLQDADLVVQPSEREEFGHAVAEALACGVPVVTGPTNGTADYLPDGHVSSFDSYTPERLADALDRALLLSREPAARAACREAAQAFAPDRVASTVARFVSRAGSL